MFSIYYLINQIFYLVLSKHRSSRVTKEYPWIFGVKIVIVLLFFTAILLKRNIIFKVNKKYNNLWIIAFKKISFLPPIKQCNVIARNILFFIYEKLYWNTYINKSFSMKVPIIIISMSYNRSNIDTRKIHLSKKWKIIALKIKKEIIGCFISFLDVDECAQPDLQTEMCRYGCINTPGSYRCAEPMELKDQPILDSLSITCLPGYEATPDGTCIGKWFNPYGWFNRKLDLPAKPRGRHFSLRTFTPLCNTLYFGCLAILVILWFPCFTIYETNHWF